MPAKQKKLEEEIVGDLKEWNVAEKLKTDGFYLFLGDRGSGKTTYTEVILQKDPFINQAIIVVMCGSAKVKANWCKSAPKLQVIDPDIQYLRNMIKTQNAHTERYLDMGLALPPHLYVNLILDDFALFKKLMNDDVMQELAASSRNLGMRIMILCQYLKQVPKESRQGFDGVFLCGDFPEADLKELHSLYANFLPKRLFVASAITYTKNRGLFVIDRREHELYKMSNPWPFEHLPLGNPTQHAYSNQHYEFLKAQKAKEIDRKSMMEDETCHLKYQDEKGVIIFKSEVQTQQPNSQENPQDIFQFRCTNQHSKLYVNTNDQISTIIQPLPNSELEEELDNLKGDSENEFEGDSENELEDN